MQAIFIGSPQVIPNTGFTPSDCFVTTAGVPNNLVRFTLGDVVRKLRSARGLTLRALAEKARVDYTSAWRLENDSDRSERRTIERIAIALKTNEAELYAWRDWLTMLDDLNASRRESVLLFARRERDAQEAEDQERTAATAPRLQDSDRKSQNAGVRKRQT
jgi:transcriptional regulator with XRE-family HTH domain